MKPLPSFLREKFDVLLVTALFIGVLTAYIVFCESEPAGYLKDVANGLLYALLALLGIRRGSAVGTASTESGDVNIQPPPGDEEQPAKTKDDGQQITIGG